MQPLFTRIRWRLVGWTMLILGLILALLGTTVYVALSRSLTDEVDRNLQISSQQALPALLGAPNQPGRNPRNDDTNQPLGGRNGYRGGVFVLHLDPSGQILANPQQVSLTGVTWPDPTDRAPILATISLNDEPTRVLVLRAPDADLLIVGQSLAPEQTALRFLLMVLVAGGGLGLLMVLGGAWFLAGRALVPIQQAFQRQQEFVADASHELRTPLTVLRSATDVLNEHRTSPLERNGELFDDVRAEIARVQRLSQDLLTLARSDSGELELMTAPVELAGLAGEVVRRTAPLAHSRDVRLGLTVDPTTPRVEADPERLQQVLLILLDNAIKHTPAGGDVDVRVNHPGLTHAQIQVEDTGIGIAAEDVPRIFDRFYRADKARSDGGTGLGLAIGKMLVEAHGGHLTLTSQPNVGTQVTVALPLAAIESTHPRYEFASTVLSQLQGWLSRFKSLEKV
ncbi:MAG TPA: HAMP domain-containing sensor histidine kinase [Chloroflexota bacterium]|nr:HAMP domain-containing sensor histidine kinase [Chloroflexota bacterium]